MDRDAKLTTTFRTLLAGPGIEPVRLPPRSPNLDAWIERFMRSIKSECLDRKIFFGEDSLRRTIREYVAHYHTERNHQRLGNAIIAPVPCSTRAFGRVRCRERLGGMLRSYHRDAAQRLRRIHRLHRPPPCADVYSPTFTSVTTRTTPAGEWTELREVVDHRM